MLGFSGLSVSPLGDFGLDGSATVSVSSLLLNSNHDSLSFDAEANITNPSVTGSASVNSVSFIGKAASPALTSVSTNSIANSSFSLTGTANFTIPSISSTFSLDIEFDAKGRSQALIGVSSSTAISGVDFDAEANITTGSLNIIGTVNAAAVQLNASASIIPLGAESVFSLNLPTPSDNLFNYDAFADDFNVSRTVFILNSALGLGNTVHIEPENFTLTLTAPNLNLANTAHISPEDFTVYIQSHKDVPTTVLITQ